MANSLLEIRERFAPAAGTGTPMNSSLKAGIAAGFIARLASTASGLMLGFYLNRVVGPANNIENVAGVIAQLTIAFFAIELFLAPVFGGWSDRIGRKPFLLAAPIIGAIAVQLHPLTTFIWVIAIGRILEGLATSSSTPATLGFLSDLTGGNSALRGRVMGLYELATLIGILGGAALGGQLWDHLGVNGLRLLSVVQILAAVLVVLFVRESKPQLKDAEAAPPTADPGFAGVVAALPDDEQIKADSSWRARRNQYFSLLRIPKLWSFAPAWIAVNAVVGLWINQAPAVLNRAERHPHQFLYGGWSGSQVSYIFVLFGVTFMLGILVWSMLYARIRKTNMMLFSIAGTFVVCATLFLINIQIFGDGFGVYALLPLLLVALFFMSGFTPVALAYLADVTEGQVKDRGAVMGLYSVFLAIGQVIGTSLGAPFIENFGFNGIIMGTLLLVTVALVAVVRLRLVTGD